MPAGTGAACRASTGPGGFRQGAAQTPLSDISSQEKDSGLRYLKILNELKNGQGALWLLAE